MIVTISWRPDDRSLFNDLAVTRFADATGAAAYLDALPDECAGRILTGDSETKLAQSVDREIEFGGKDLLALFNALRIAEEPEVKKFENLATARRRLTSRIWQIAAVQEEDVLSYKTNVNRADYDASVIARAECFYATAFRGGPKLYDVSRAKTLAEARKIAKTMVTDRPVTIYAVAEGRQVHVENIEVTTMPKHQEEELLDENEVGDDETDGDIDEADEADEDFVADEAEGEPKAPRYKLGDSKQVRRSSNLGKIAAAAGSEIVRLGHIVDQTGLDTSKVLNALRAGRGSHGIDFRLTEVARNGRENNYGPAYVEVIPPSGYDHETMFAPEKEAAAPPAERAPRQHIMGMPKQVKRTSNLGKVLEAVGAEGAAMDDIVGLIGLDADKVVAVLRAGRASHGVDHELTGHRAGRAVDFAAAFVKVTPPDGYDHETVFVAEKKVQQPQSQSNGEEKPRTNKIVEAAKQGIIPQAPDFSANTHRSYRKRLAEIVALVEARDLEKLREYHIHISGPGSTSPIAMNKYRERAIIAIEAQNAR